MYTDTTTCDAIKPHLLEYLEEVSTPRGNGKYNCPVCGSGERSGGTAALQYYPDSNSFTCFSCGAAGTLIDLYKAHHETDTGTAIRELSAKYGIQEPEKPKAPRRRLDDQTRAHDYHNADGSLFGRKVVYKYDDGSKSASWFLFDQAAQQFSLAQGLQGRPAPLYNLPGILNSSGAVYIVEGEKDAETLRALGLTATTAPNGASAKWRTEYNAALQGRDVVIITDNDEPGRKYGKTVANGTRGAAQSVKLIQATDIYKECPKKGDVSDIAGIMGGAWTLEAVQAAAATAAEYNPATAPDDQTGKPPKVFKARIAAEVEEDNTRFTWYPYIPAGDYTVLMAPGGTGKTFFCCGIAAAISSGQGLPMYRVDLNGDPYTERQKTAPKNVLLISAEDRAPMIRKRLEASGAALDRCFILDCMDTNGLLLPSGADDEAGNFTWNTLLDEYKPEYVVIDPWHSFIDSSVDLNKVNAARQVLHNIAVLCKNHDCSIILVSHVNKKAQGENINNAATGSSDLVNAARSALYVLSDPGDDSRKIVVHTKSNYAIAGKSLQFKITSGAGLEWDGFSEITRATLEEAARSKRTAAECLIDKESADEMRRELLQAITDMSVHGEAVSVRYQRLIDDYGSGIYSGMKPQKALELLRGDLLARGIELTNFSKQVREGGKTGRGFVISCMMTPEQMAAALPK